MPSSIGGYRGFGPYGYGRQGYADYRRSLRWPVYSDEGSIPEPVFPSTKISIPTATIRKVAETPMGAGMAAVIQATTTATITATSSTWPMPGLTRCCEAR